MSKFKVGDKVALKSNPNKPIGQIEYKTFGGYYIDIGKGYYTVISENMLVSYHEEIPDMSDDEIYDMLKPKMDKAGLLKHSYYYRDHTMFYTDEVIGAIALAYRSGYLRAKKGRPFKIGGEKE